MRKILIISPYFSPSNDADTHRVRMSLPYYSEFNWEPTIVCVDSKYYESSSDKLLEQTIPGNIKIHSVTALNKKFTRLIGLGSIALRSILSFKRKVDHILKHDKFDLIFFSTTQFPICILGPYWKNKFGIPYIIDLQDPWITDYYDDKPKTERPPKYRIASKLNIILENIAMKSVGGLMTVSDSYVIDTFKRHPYLRKVPFAEITFGFSEVDMELAKTLKKSSKANPSKKLLTYIGVLGPMMRTSLTLFLKAIGSLSNFQQDYDILFKGTRYVNDTSFSGILQNLLNNFNIDNISEEPDRVSIIHALNLMANSDGLLLFGTDDNSYNASKLYPLLQSNKPILAILHPTSKAFDLINELSNAIVISIFADLEEAIYKLELYIKLLQSNDYYVDQSKLKDYSAKQLTFRQTLLFNDVIKYENTYYRK